MKDAEDAPVLVYEFYAGRAWSGRIAPVAELLRQITVQQGQAWLRAMLREIGVDVRSR